MAINGKVTQDFTGNSSKYDFGTYTDPNTGLTTQAMSLPPQVSASLGPTTTGGSTTITVTPTNPAGESVAQYASEIQSQLAAHGITGINATAANGVLSIVGPDTATIAGTVSQNMLGTTSNLRIRNQCDDRSHDQPDHCRADRQRNGRNHYCPVHRHRRNIRAVCHFPEQRALGGWHC